MLSPGMFLLYITPAAPVPACVDVPCASPTALRVDNFFPQLSRHACEASAGSALRFHHISLFLSFPLLPRVFSSCFPSIRVSYTLLAVDLI
ncbi:hypothetical protein C8J57DRAFT_1333346, partial [Mycena rebaudengoi]